MRKITTIGLAAAVAALPVISLMGPAESAQARPHRPVRAAPDHHRWNKGERFDRRRADHYTVIDYRHYRGLRAPPRGYHWVRSGNDAVLVAISTGIIASVIANAVH